MLPTVLDRNNYASVLCFCTKVTEIGSRQNVVLTQTEFECGCLFIQRLAQENPLKRKTKIRTFVKMNFSDIQLIVNTVNIKLNFYIDNVGFDR